jgi:hypothetical protein
MEKAGNPWAGFLGKDMGGMRMKHYKTEEWIDFARGLIEGEAKSFMQSHLKSGCRDCTREAKFWQRVSQTAKRENALEPPADAVRVAKAMMATAGIAGKAKRKSVFAELLFDSLRTPLAAGVRSAAANARQMLYGSGNHRIDLRLEPQLDSDGVEIVGQILDSSSPEQGLKGVQVSLYAGKKMIAVSQTSQLGEFQISCKLDENLELRIMLPQGREVRLGLVEPKVSSEKRGPYLTDKKEDIRTRGTGRKPFKRSD